MNYTHWCRTVTFYFLNPATTRWQQQSKESPALVLQHCGKSGLKRGFVRFVSWQQVDQCLSGVDLSLWGYHTCLVSFFFKAVDLSGVILGCDCEVFWGKNQLICFAALNIPTMANIFILIFFSKFCIFNILHTFYLLVCAVIYHVL